MFCIVENRNQDQLSRRLMTSDVFNEDNAILKTSLKNLPEEEFEDTNEMKNSLASLRNIGTDYSYKHKYVLTNVIIAIVFHILAFYGLGNLLGGGRKETMLWVVFLAFMSCEGVTVGAHRYYTHKSFKAKPFLRAVLIILQTLAGQNSIFVWVRDHRLHHRFSDTDADPHNSKRGFFFCHMGWLMTRKHPLIKILGKKIDMSDLQADWMVMFQKKYYMPLYLFVSVFIPVWVSVHFFGETLGNAILISYFFRYAFVLHATWLVNSASHLYGLRPFDKNLQAVESWFVSMITLGEGWHNYHHAFPWDYKAAELSTLFNLSAYVIKFFEYVGFAWDLKTASPQLVAKRIIRTGDGTHYLLGNDEAKAAVTAVGVVHPLNPSYTTTHKSPDTILKPEGLPLFHDGDILSTNQDIINN